MDHKDKKTLLDSISSPADIRALKVEELPQLCAEVRQFIIDVLAHNPGHLASSLGTIELTIALHYVFDTPDDRLIWDVGHQAYAHKVLTGRKSLFRTIRTYKGLSGFPRQIESEYDTFGTGHASTSISAALGMAVASNLQGKEDRQHIAVIGDGSMTGGMAFEALNHAGVSDANLLVVLNDNGIAIDKNVGALGLYLTRISTSKTYNRLKNKIWKMLGGDSHIRIRSKNFFRKTLNGMKAIFAGRSDFFEALNIRYFGPIDGNNVIGLVEVMRDLKKINGPKLLHIVTTKGKGLDKAEQKPTVYHAPGEFDPETGELIADPSDINISQKYQDVFGETIIHLAKENEKIIGITPAMPSGCSLNQMMEEMPDRAFDVGIAEAHAATFSAGLAAEGMIPFCNIYSSFMQRAYDQVIHDVALQKLHVVFCLDRAGLVGEDGATHQGVFDLSYFRPIPNLTICAPLNEQELRDMMYTAQLGKNKGSFIIRYPRGRGVLSQPYPIMREIPIGRGTLLHTGHQAVILSLGHVGNLAVQAAQLLHMLGIEVEVYNMRFLKPIDEDLLHQVGKKHQYVFTLEDGAVIGGLGSAVIEFLNENGYAAQVFRFGVPDFFVEHGKVEDLQRLCHFDMESIVDTIKNRVEQSSEVTKEEEEK